MKEEKEPGVRWTQHTLGPILRRMIEENEDEYYFNLYTTAGKIIQEFTIIKRKRKGKRKKPFDT